MFISQNIFTLSSKLQSALNRHGKKTDNTETPSPAKHEIREIEFHTSDASGITSSPREIDLSQMGDSLLAGSPSKEDCLSKGSQIESEAIAMIETKSKILSPTTRREAGQ